MDQKFWAPTAERVRDEWQAAWNEAATEISRDSQARGAWNSSGRFNQLADAAADTFRQACLVAEQHVNDLLAAVTDSNELEGPDSAAHFVLGAALKQAIAAAMGTVPAAAAIGLMSDLMIGAAAEAAKQRILSLADSRAKVIAQKIALRRDQLRSRGSKSILENASFGDNASIQIGDNNIQNVDIGISAGDFQSLAQELRRHNVSSTDLSELKNAIDKDKGAPELSHRKFGPSVRSWIAKMFEKAVETSWQIEIGMVGSLLAASLQKYYGF
jgi:hypothetical protein